MGNQLPDTSVDPEPIIADLRPRLAERTAERNETVEQQTATAGVLQSSIPRPAISRALVGRMLDKAMRLCARWWRKFSTSMISRKRPAPPDESRPRPEKTRRRYFARRLGHRRR